MVLKTLLAGLLALSFTAPALAAPQTVSNSVVSLGVSGSRGGSIDSFKILGTEIVDTADLGREIQASLFFNSQQPGLQQNNTTCNASPPPWLNPQDAGNECGVASPWYALGKTGNRLDVGTLPKEWHGRGNGPNNLINGLRIEGHHTVGPLPYANFNEVTQLRYQVFWNAEYAGQPALQFQRSVFDGNSQPTPTSFLPAAYFKSSQFVRPVGLPMDGGDWVDLQPSANVSTGSYTPSLYRFRAVAWMRQDLSLGVALYARSTLNQTCAQTFTMELPQQQGQCPNFAVVGFPALGAVNVSVVDQSLTSIPLNGSVERVAHMFVGNLPTMRSQINAVYNSGN